MLRPSSRRRACEWSTLEELFRQSDVVSLHCPLDAANGESGQCRAAFVDEADGLSDQHQPRPVGGRKRLGRCAQRRPLGRGGLGRAFGRAAAGRSSAASREELLHHAPHRLGDRLGPPPALGRSGGEYPLVSGRNAAKRSGMNDRKGRVEKGSFSRGFSRDRGVFPKHL